MRLIVGLGNPGIEYAWTPHNLGFLVVDVLAEDAGIRVTRPEAKSLVGLGQIAGREVVLAKPQTMMNLSGLAVRELVSRAECEPSDVIVVCDDVALPWGMLRVRERGTAGGHNGLKSVIGAIGHDGICPRAPGREARGNARRSERVRDFARFGATKRIWSPRKSSRAPKP